MIFIYKKIIIILYIFFFKLVIFGYKISDFQEKKMTLPLIIDIKQISEN